MQRGKQPLWRRKIVFVVVFLVVNLISIAFLAVREKAAVNQKLFDQAAETEAQFGEIMETYERSFQLFAHMMAREIEHEPDPDSVRTYLKGMYASLLNIVGRRMTDFTCITRGSTYTAGTRPIPSMKIPVMW